MTTLKRVAKLTHLEKLRHEREHEKRHDNS
jgi:hypothetical protein